MSPPPQPPPHAPDLGRMRQWLGAFHVTGVFWYRFHRWGVTVLPNPGVWAFIALFTTFFFVVLRRIRRAIAANLEVVLGPCGWWRRQARIYRTMWNFAWCLSERYERLSTARRTRTEISGEDLWRALHDSSHGFLLITAHLGHWEVGSLLVPERRVHVVREEEMDPRAQAFVRGLFAEQGDVRVTMHFARDDPSLGVRLLAALRRGQIVAVQGDRPRSTGRTFRIDVFGQPLDLPAGPVALARSAQAPMLPVFVFRRGRLRAEVVFRPPIRVDGSGDEALVTAVRQIAAEIEWAVRQEPHQWFCFRELWPERRRHRLTARGPAPPTPRRRRSPGC